ncbi:MAG TPA: PQQ-dependent sugar dehydrogenase, partial [Gemmatimonadales bacterium]|nr:PQQ-dependent sugar dehydrogenase [Gemmatimonadales bacterium]
MFPSALTGLLAIAVACSSTDPRPGPDPNAPVVTITSPADNASVPESSAVLLAGGAVDDNGAVLPGSVLLWSSSIDGALGTGDSVVLSTLTAGHHTITLSATDTAGLTGQASVTLNVVGTAPTLGLDTIASGFDSPIFLTAPPGDTTRLFVVEQSGAIRIIKNGVVLGTPFLNLHDSLSTGGEQGLLGLAFDPNYATTGRFFVSYTRQNGDSRLARYNVSADPDVASEASGVTILGVPQPYSNHNGGGIAFGPDNYLYFGLGDGGSGGDPDGHGQRRDELLGSMLRLDVSGATYTIPGTNPYASSTAFRQELWNYGLRNPWRWSFDRLTGDLYIGDVGQGDYEEVDVQPSGSSGGENYGWNTMEGTHCYPDASPCNQAGLALPVLDYGHGQGCSVTGGYVYRGQDIPSL